ncbi:MAG: hypothetical protein ACQGVK_06715 [Myxococcota bacterium]
MRLNHWFLIGILAFVHTVACNTPVIRVLWPKADSEHTHMPIDLRVDMAATADTGTLVVRLNGVDVTADFTLSTPPSGRLLAEALGFFDPAVLADGANLLEVEVEVAGELETASSAFALSGDPYADAVAAFSPGAGAGFGVAADALGGPAGAGPFTGSLAVVSLGLGGTIELEFVDNVVVDEEGVDLTVFENALLEVSPGLLSEPPYSEPGRVSVSQDGSTWYAFPCSLDALEAPYHPGCAGVYPVMAHAGVPSGPHASEPSDVPIEDLVGQPVLSFPTPEGSGGDSFDLADLGLDWIRYVRVEAAPFETPPSGPDNVAFDLDAVSAVHSLPFVDENTNGIPDFAE